MNVIWFILQKMVTRQISLNQLMDLKKNVYTYKISYYTASFKKVIWYMHYAEWNKLGSKSNTLYNSIFKIYWKRQDQNVND